MPLRAACAAAQDTQPLQQIITGTLDWGSETDILSRAVVGPTQDGQFGLFAAADIDAGRVVLLSKALHVRLPPKPLYSPH